MPKTAICKWDSWSIQESHKHYRIFPVTSWLKIRFILGFIFYTVRQLRHCVAASLHRCVMREDLANSVNSESYVLRGKILALTQILLTASCKNDKNDKNINKPIFFILLTSRTNFSCVTHKFFLRHAQIFLASRTNFSCVTHKFFLRHAHIFLASRTNFSCVTQKWQFFFFRTSTTL